MKDTFIKDKTNPIIPVHFNLQMLSIKGHNSLSQHVLLLEIHISFCYNQEGATDKILNEAQKKSNGGASNGEQVSFALSWWTTRVLVSTL